MNPVAAVSLMLLASLAAAQAPTPYAQALAKTRLAYLTQKAGQPTLDVVAKLPTPPPELEAGHAAIALAVDAAKDVQLGCTAPCAAPADVQVYAGKVEMIARRLGMNDAESKAALEHYIPAGKPRLRVSGAPNGPANDAAKAAEAEVVTRMLADGQLPPAIREGLNRKALAMADALGKTQELKADADGVVRLPDGGQARLTAAQLARLNAMPQTQANILRRLVTNPPPAPMTAAQRQAQALADADREVAANPGLIGDTYNYWDREAKDPNSNWFWKGYAHVNKGLLTFSGLKAVEESSGRFGYVWDNADVGKGEKFWLGSKLAGNMALSFVTFLPAAAVAKELTASAKVGIAAAAETGSALSGAKTGLTAAKDSFYWIGKGGKAIPGLAKAAPEAAETMSAAGKGLSQTIVKALPDGAKVGKAELRTLVGSLNDKVARYGVEIVEGGTTGESVAKGGKIFVSLDVGAKHEMVHVVQQTYSRVLALEEVAARGGTTVEALNAAQRAEAFAAAEKFEVASYAQLESQAYRATGFMGLGGGVKYTRQLLLTGQEVSSGVKNGAVLDGSFSLGQRFYGGLTQWGGHSQAELMRAVGSTTAGTSQTPLFDPIKQMVDGVVQGHLVPNDPPPAAAGTLPSAR